jgi:putative aldouronate transport system substrate-binding protein
MNFIDAFYDEKVSMQVLFGGMNDTDKGIKDNGDGTYEVLPPADESIDPGSWKWTIALADNGPFYIRDGINLKLGTDMEIVKDEKSVYQEILDKIDPKSNQYPQGFMKYSKDDINSMAMSQVNIKNITEQQWAVWMTGDADIEKEWDSYVDDVDKAGLSENLEIRQKAYEAYLDTVE